MSYQSVDYMCQLSAYLLGRRIPGKCFAHLQSGVCVSNTYRTSSHSGECPPRLFEKPVKPQKLRRGSAGAGRSSTFLSLVVWCLRAAKGTVRCFLVHYRRYLRFAASDVRLQVEEGEV